MMRFAGIAVVATALLFAGAGGTATAQPVHTQSARTESVRIQAATCKSADLNIAFGRTEGAAGTVYREVLFTNRAIATCVLQGFPGVSYVDADGNQVGTAAVRDGEGGPLLTLPHGTTVLAVVGFAQIGNFDPEVCRPTPVWGIKVFPPDETVPLYLPTPGQYGCAGDTSPFGNQLKVTSVRS